MLETNFDKFHVFLFDKVFSYLSTSVWNALVKYINMFFSVLKNEKQTNGCFIAFRKKVHGKFLRKIELESPHRMKINEKFVKTSLLETSFLFTGLKPNINEFSRGHFYPLQPGLPCLQRPYLIFFRCNCHTKRLFVSFAMFFHLDKCDIWSGGHGTHVVGNFSNTSHHICICIHTA